MYNSSNIYLIQEEEQQRGPEDNILSNQFSFKKLKNKRGLVEEKKTHRKAEEGLISIQNEKKSPAEDRTKSKVSRAVDVVSHRY